MYDNRYYPQYSAVPYYVINSFCSQSKITMFYTQIHLKHVFRRLFNRAILAVFINGLQFSLESGYTSADVLTGEVLRMLKTVCPLTSCRISPKPLPPRSKSLLDPVSHYPSPSMTHFI